MKVFIEEQKFHPLLLVGLTMMLILLIAVLLEDINKVLNGTTFDLVASISSLIILLALLILFMYLKLKTRIDEIGVHFKFSPFHKTYRVIKWNEIKDLHIRKYNAISEYKGWGYRGNEATIRKEVGTAYTTRGSIGLQIILKNDTRVLIGTQKKEEIQRILTNYKNIEANEVM